MKPQGDGGEITCPMWWGVTLTIAITASKACGSSIKVSGGDFSVPILLYCTFLTHSLPCNQSTPKRSHTSRRRDKHLRRQQRGFPQLEIELGRLCLIHWHLRSMCCGGWPMEEATPNAASRGGNQGFQLYPNNKWWSIPCGLHGQLPLPLVRRNTNAEEKGKEMS